MQAKLKVTLFVLGASGLSSHCKSTDSGVKDADFITNGMDVAASSAPFTWASQMGLTLDGAGGGVHIGATRMASFATAVGLARDDIIMTLNGTPVSNVAEFEASCDSFAGGSGSRLANWNGEWIFQVKRAGQSITVKRPPGYNCDGYWLANCGPFGAGNQ